MLIKALAKDEREECIKLLEKSTINTQIHKYRNTQSGARIRSDCYIKQRLRPEKQFKESFRVMQSAEKERYLSEQEQM
jgi:hypothetical protein